MINLEYIKHKINLYFSNTSVKEVNLCGSFARGCATEKSDIDLLLFLKQEDNSKAELSSWQSDLEEMFGREVELFIGSDKPFTGYKFAFYERLYREKVLLYCKD